MQIVIQIPPSGRFHPAPLRPEEAFTADDAIVDVWALLYALGSKLYLRYSTRIRETQGDKRHYEGSHIGQIYDFTLLNRRKYSISFVTPRYDQFTFSNRDLTDHLFYRGSATLINRVAFHGDKAEPGNRDANPPWMELIFNPAVIRLALAMP